MLLLVGCDEQTESETPESIQNERLPDHGDPPDGDEDPLGARLYTLGMERLRRLAPDSPVLRGTLRTGEVEDHPVMMLGTHCYSFLGVGSEEVQDLDLILTNPLGAPVKHDETQARETDLGIVDSICPVEPGMYKIRIRMFRGRGDYAVRMYSHQII